MVIEYLTTCRNLKLQMRDSNLILRLQSHQKEAFVGCIPRIFADNSILMLRDNTVVVAKTTTTTTTINNGNNKAKQKEAKKFDVRSQNLESFPEGLFDPQRAPSIEEVYVCFNKIPTIPREITLLSNMKKFDLHDNLIESIPDDVLRHLTNLETLDLGKNRFPEGGFPPQIAEAKSVRRLLFNFNALTEISISILEQLPKLDALFVRNNKLTSLQPELFVKPNRNDHDDPDQISDGPLSRLHALCVGFNSISQLPREIGMGGLTKTLLTLELSNNRLVSPLPVELCNLVQLKRLDLRNNLLEYLPMQITNLINLEQLNLANNPLITPPPPPPHSDAATTNNNNNVVFISFLNHKQLPVR